jgi:hypothetical protein
VETTPTFTWQAFDATNYQLQVDTEPSFVPPTAINETGITGTNFTPASPLEEGTTYYVRVTARNVSCPQGVQSQTTIFATIVSPGATIRSPEPLPSGPDPTDYGIVSIPIIPFDGDALAVLGFPFYDTTEVRVLRWDSTLATLAGLGDYREYDDGLTPPFPEFAPGLGFWVLTSQTLAGNLFQVTGDPVDTTQDFVIVLQRDWNQVGTPFPFAICKTSLMVRKNGITFPLSSQDPQDPWVEDQLLAYRADYVPQNQMVPFEGYFMNNISTDLQPVEVLVAPELCLTPGNLPQGEEDGGWRVKIGVTSHSMHDAHNYLGLAPSSQEGYDPGDLQEPPAIAPGRVSLYFPHEDWIDFPGNYRTDIRSLASDREVFTFTVDTKRRLALSKLTWENVPDNYTLTLTDTKTGRKVNMNTRKAYFFLTLFDPIRNFEVEAVRR